MGDDIDDDDGRFYSSKYDEKDNSISKPGIEEDLKKFEFPEDIKREASTTYRELTCGSVRSTNRLMAICFCVYQAYIDINKPYDVIIIGDKINLDCDKADSSITMFSKKLTGKHKSGCIKPMDFVRCYSEYEFDLSVSSIDSIESIWNDLCKRDRSLNEDTIRKITAGLIWYYFMENEVDNYSIEAFSKVFHFKTIMPVSKIYEKMLEASRKNIVVRKKVVFPSNIRK